MMTDSSTIPAPTVPADDTDVITITDPHDGTLVGSIPICPTEEVRRAVAEAAVAQPSWAATQASERATMLRSAANQLAERVHELAELNHRETGRPIDEAAGGIRAGVDTLLQYSELGPLHRGHSLAGSGLSSDYTRFEPRGVAAVVTPWNDPIAVAAGLVGAALVTGNTVVYKPSERCPHVGLAFGEIIQAALPTHVMHTVVGDGRTGQTLVSDPSVDVVAHVGSTDTGERIARATALTGAHLIRENGGNDALVVDRDVDPAWAAEQAAIGAFTNTGQICTSVERIYVHRDIAEEFIAALAQEAERRNGNGSLGPLVDERMREAVDDQVRASIDAGARAVVGGAPLRGAGCYYPATVLVDCAPGMPVMTEETFGPVAPVMVVDDFDSGIELAARDRYGLAATVLTGSIRNANHAVDALPVGTVKVNAVFGGAPGGAAQPRGASGSGFGYGPELLDEFSTVKVVHIEEAVAR
jgi:acyl-CoA reductase-like NAD-dependent aldehyde dehydrogenase